ncbi:aldehyde dehydrogenase family protein, partial [Veillonella caviae]
MSLNLKERYGLLINNEWVPASDNAEFLVYNPANGEQLSICAEATYDDVDRAVQVANEAFKTWRHTSQIERADLLLKIADAIEARKEHFAKVETYDNGKPIRETLNVDVPLAVDHFRYFAGVLRAEEGSAQVFDENTLSLILREPIGVVGQVVPWNFPFLMAAWKLAPALAAGCTVVIKPSSHTSLSLLELGDILKDILPPGVVNIITGKGSKSGQYILDHPGFSKLAFTGSTEVGLDVYKAASERLIPATLELGGKSANIFFDDANWKQALDGAMLGILFNQGQVCCAGSRIFVQDTIYDTFVEELAALFDKVQVGLPWDENTQLGSLIYEGQVQKVLEYVDIAKQEGATIVAGGVRVTDGELGKGCFVRPTLIANATNDMRVAREEIFGPVAVVIKFHSEDEVIAAANDSLYGLGGGVWTQNINR